tara:strand:+ start:17407 stop:17766 length:360 start_codon:yes stop_codon:yes gene_type:complete
MNEDITSFVIKKWIFVRYDIIQKLLLYQNIDNYESNLENEIINFCSKFVDRYGDFMDFHKLFSQIGFHKTLYLLYDLDYPIDTIIFFINNPSYSSLNFDTKLDMIFPIILNIINEYENF